MEITFGFFHYQILQAFFMNKSDYLKNLEKLKNLADSIPNTQFLAKMKINTLVIMNMRYEKIMLNRNLQNHPHELVSQLIDDACDFLTQCFEVAWIEGNQIEFAKNEQNMEENHQDLFQKLWVDYSDEEYKAERVGRYKKRIEINQLAPLIAGKKCIDCGCGHGNFALALSDYGAEYVLGIDYGSDAIQFANKMRDLLGYSGEKIEFKVESVYQLPSSDDAYDFAIQNGVFHHLEDEDAAYKEVYRILKPGAYFWIYTDSEGAIGPTLYDVSRYILRDVPNAFVIRCLSELNISTNKRYHLGDGFNAVYRHTNYEDFIKRLGSYGFGNFRRLVGGFPTDFDHDVIQQDKYGKEKFGSGDLRILAQKI